MPETRELHAAVTEAVNSVFSLMPAGPAPDGAGGSHPDSAAASYCARVKVVLSGASHLYLCVPATLCRRVLAKLFPGETCAPSPEQETVVELLNLIVESTRTLMRQQGTVLDIGVPQPVTPVPSPNPDVPILELPQLGEALSLWLK